MVQGNSGVVELIRPLLHSEYALMIRCTSRKVFANMSHRNTGNANMGHLTTAEHIQKEQKAATKGKKATLS